MLGQWWTIVGLMLGKWWTNNGSVMYQSWANDGPMLRQWLINAGTNAQPMLDQCWTNAGPMMDHYCELFHMVDVLRLLFLLSSTPHLPSLTPISCISCPNMVWCLHFSYLYALIMNLDISWMTKDDVSFAKHSLCSCFQSTTSGEWCYQNGDLLPDWIMWANWVIPNIADNAHVCCQSRPKLMFQLFCCLLNHFRSLSMLMRIR